MPERDEAVTASWVVELDSFERDVWPAFKDRGISKSSAWITCQLNELVALIDQRLPAEPVEPWQDP